MLLLRSIPELTIYHNSMAMLLPSSILALTIYRNSIT